MVIFRHMTAMVKQKVKPSQIQGPTSLTTVKFFSYYEILEVLVVSPDLYWMGRSFQGSASTLLARG